MCGRPDFRKPEKKLADLLLQETGVRIDEHLLRLFIRAHWDRIASLAHGIHETAPSPLRGQNGEPIGNG